MISHFKIRCRSFVWYLIVAFTICSIPHFELLPAELAGMLGQEAYAASVPAVSPGGEGKTADGGVSSSVSLNISRFTGAAKARIPIVVAPGRSEATTRSWHSHTAAPAATAGWEWAGHWRRDTSNGAISPMTII